MNSVQIYCRQPDNRLDLTALEALAKKVIHAEGYSFPVTAVIINNAEIKRLNLLFLQKNEVTDVLAFPDADDRSTGAEIYINLDEADAQAAEIGESIPTAAARLLVHGILHLCGWNDDTPAKRKKMIEHGEGYLQELNSSGFNKSTRSIEKQ